MSVEAVDYVYQTIMLDMLKQTGRPEIVVGWYHSHPGFGCWLSGVDMNTQTSFERLNARAVFLRLFFGDLSSKVITFEISQVAVVVDPVQSVKGKVVIDAFRMIDTRGRMIPIPGVEPRQTTTNIGFLKKPTIQARIHGLDRHYYSLVIDWRKNDLEEQMLMNLHKRDWTSGLVVKRFEDHEKRTENMLGEMARLSRDYADRVKQEEGRTPEEVEVMNVGKVDPKKRLENDLGELIAGSIIQCLGTMLDTVVF